MYLNLTLAVTALKVLLTQMSQFLNMRVLQSQRMIQVGRDLWGSYFPAPRSKQGQLGTGFTGPWTIKFVTSPKMEISKPPQASVPFLTALTVKLFFLISNQNFPHYKFCLFLLVIFLFASESGSVFSSPSHYVVVGSSKIPPKISLPKADQTQLSESVLHFTLTPIYFRGHLSFSCTSVLWSSFPSSSFSLQQK